MWFLSVVSCGLDGTATEEPPPEREPAAGPVPGEAPPAAVDGSSDGGAPPAEAAPLPPTSDDLIAAALARGEITQDTALTYRVFAVRGDARLPAAFRASQTGESTAIQDAHRQWSTLSADARAAITPLVLRPSSQGSWLNPVTSQAHAATADSGIPPCRGMDANWRSDSLPTHKVMVWYDGRVTGQKEKAAVVQDAVETRIWPKLIDQLGFRAPHDKQVDTCNGGDERLDVELLPPPCPWHGGRAVPQFRERVFSRAGGYVELCSDLSDDLLRTTAAHEVMHAIQFNYFDRQSDAEWVVESSANWAVDAVYARSIQTEHRDASCYYRQVGAGLSEQRPCAGDELNPYDHYGKYMVHQFLAAQDPNAVRGMFEAMAGGATGSAAFHDLGYDKKWKDLAREMGALTSYQSGHTGSRRFDTVTAGRPPVADAFFPNADDLRPDDGVKRVGAITWWLGMDQLYVHRRWIAPLELPSLSMVIHDIRIDRADAPDLRSLLFHNPLFDASPGNDTGIHVQALWRAENSTEWRKEDWTPYEWVGFCRDVKEQRVEDLIIVFSNSEWHPSAPARTFPDQPSFHQSRMGCFSYTGTADMVNLPASWSGTGKRGHSNIRFEADPRLQGLDAKHPAIPNSLRAGVGTMMPLKGTDYSYEVAFAARGGGCAYSFGPATYPLGAQPSYGFLMMNPFPVLKDVATGESATWFAHQNGAYSGLISTMQPVTVTVTNTPGSKGCGPTEEDMIGSLLATNTGDHDLPTSATDGALRGTLRPTNDVVFTWSLTPVLQ